MSGLNRRSFVKAAGATGAGAAMSGTASALETVADGLDTEGGEQEAIVVFRGTDDRAALDAFDLAGRFDYEVLPMSWVRLTGPQLETLAGDDRVRYVSDTYELDYYNDRESRKAMGSCAANEAGYDGENVDVAVIDSGVDATHPDLRDHVESNYVYVDNPLGERNAMWKDVGISDPDRVGHGTHCCGTVVGDGTASRNGASTQGKTYVGMAPEASLSSYAVGATVYLPYAVGAWDHMLRRKQSPLDEFDPVVCSNSYGVARGNRYNPLDPLNVATWEAFQTGVLPVFAAGNDGPGEGTLNRYAKAPHVLGVAAAAGTPEDKSVTGFSSRGRSVGQDNGVGLPGGGTVTGVYHNRATLLGNMEAYHEATKTGKIQQTSGTMSGTLGPAVNAAGYVNAAGEKQAHVLELPPSSDVFEGHLDVTPDGQQVTVSFYKNYGDDDQELLAQMGEEPVYIHHDIAFDVPDGETLTVTFESENGPQTQYEFDYTVYRTVDLKGNNVELDALRPLTLYRPGVTTHGQAVMSTVNKYDVVGALGPLYGSGAEEPVYGPLSGTSMACPGAAGIAALVVEAGREAGLDYVGHGSDRAGDSGTFTTLDVMLTIEATAEEARTAYTPANAGPGYINAATATARANDGSFAVFDDVSLASPDVPQPKSSLTASGDRSDDGSVFTKGQTDRVELTLSSADLTNTEDDVSGVTVEDTVPAGWTVLGQYSDTDEVRNPDADSESIAVFEGVSEDETVVYFVEAQGGSGPYTFGPATAITDADIDGSKESDFGGTDTNYIVGQSTEF